MNQLLHQHMVDILDGRTELPPTAPDPIRRELWKREAFRAVVRSLISRFLDELLSGVTLDRERIEDHLALVISWRMFSPEKW